MITYAWKSTRDNAWKTNFECVEEEFEDIKGDIREYHTVRIVQN